MGTWSYAAPEQLADAKRADHRSDIYSCGATLYEMLTGDPPRHIHETAIPKPVRPIVMKCLAQTPGERYQSAQEFLNALSQAYRTTMPAPNTAAPAARSTPKPTAASGTAEEPVLWRAHRTLWSRPIRTTASVAALVWLRIAQSKVDETVHAWLTEFSRQEGPEGLQNALETMAGWPHAKILMGIALWFLLLSAVRCIRTAYRLTPTRLFVREGAIGVTESDYLLNEIDKVSMRRGLLGSLLDYGEITLTRPRRLPLLIEGVPHPSAAREIIAAQVARTQAKRPSSEETTVIVNSGPEAKR